jgi:hypothetical protein
MEMMKIKLSPQRRDDDLTLIKDKDCLLINGEIFDFSQLVEGAVLPFGSINCDFIVGDVYRKNGVIELVIVLPYNKHHSNQRKFPTDIIINFDGEVELPI